MAWRSMDYVFPHQSLSMKTPPDTPVGQSAGGNSSAETPFPQETLMCVKLTFNPAIRAGTQLLVQCDIYFQVYYVILATYPCRQDVHPLSTIFMYRWRRVWWSWWTDVPVVRQLIPVAKANTSPAPRRDTGWQSASSRLSVSLWFYTQCAFRGL